MREFNLDLLIGKEVVVNCKTKAEEEDFLQYLDSKDIKWNGGDSIFKYNYYSYNDYESKTCFTLLENKGLLQYSPIEYFQERNYKILSLYDLVIKPKNNFKEYGFEADFEGEICFENLNGFYIGYINKPIGKLFKQWRKNDGGCFCIEGYYDRQYDLKPIKKEWYENPDNFPCIATKDGKNFAVIESIDCLKRVCIYQYIVDFRPATKEEVLDLLVKE